MNKVFNINLGGQAFTIDEEAFFHLEKYLKAIDNHFRDSEGHEEIVSDIETRLAELFQENLGGRPIVTLKDVKRTISIMGTPEEFGAEPLDEPLSEPKSNTHSRKQTNQTGKSWKTGKRLFRNPEDEVVAGVCSGIAAYFGITDPLWIRLGFVALTLMGFGTAIPLYIILWAVLPKAETASDRLSMRGETINVSNIGRIIEEEMDHISTKIEDWGEDVERWGDDMNQKYGSKKKVLAKEPEMVGQQLAEPLPRGYIS
ncbi:MAG: PspC domain-containing protein [Saprospiraceae bacterium]|nr:PspC domain-containing protein [Saprospiraceae bacterium]